MEINLKTILYKSWLITIQQADQVVSYADLLPEALASSDSDAAREAPPEPFGDEVNESFYDSYHLIVECTRLLLRLVEFLKKKNSNKVKNLIIFKT